MFYNLDKSKPYSVFGGAHGKGLSIFLLCFAASFILAGIILFALTLAGVAEEDIFIAAAVLTVVGLACFIGILFAVLKNHKRRLEEKLMIENGDLTTGTIENYQCIQKSDGNGGYTYAVKFDYAFENLEGNKLTQNFNKTLPYKPNFYQGKKIMVCFLGDSSIILNKFSLIGHEDLMKVETPKEPYLGLTRENVNINKNQRIIAEKNPFKLYISAAIFGFMAVLVFILSYFIMSQGSFLTTDFALSSIIWGVFSLAALVLMIVARSIQRKVTAFLDNCNFAYANIFNFDTPYTDSGEVEYTYYFIDLNGEQKSGRTKVLPKDASAKPASQSADESNRVIVAYDNTQSMLILKCVEIK